MHRTQNTLKLNNRICSVSQKLLIMVFIFSHFLELFNHTALKQTPIIFIVTSEKFVRGKISYFLLYCHELWKSFILCVDKYSQIRIHVIHELQSKAYQKLMASLENEYEVNPQMHQHTHIYPHHRQIHSVRCPSSGLLPVSRHGF